MPPNSWREAASIIIAARSSFQHASKYNSNFKVLMLKRGKTSPFMPGSYVFPGGVVEPADNLKEWLQLYNGFGFSNQLSENKTENLNVLRTITSSISFQITAIRETFEEAGILLCKRRHVHSEPSETNWASFISGYETEEWQNKVRKDPKQFLEVCKHFKCVPDVWGIQLWSNWLTPTHNTKRFNTKFFIAVLDQMPPATHDKSEMESLKWSFVNELLFMGNCGKISLPPPQIYELARLQNFNDIDNLLSFANERLNFGYIQWMPLHIKTTDGILFILPGDDLYPENPDIFLVGTKLCEVQKTAQEMRDGCKKLHRIEYIGHGKAKVLINNVAPSCGHRLPVHSIQSSGL